MSRGYLLDTNIPSEFSKPLPHPPLRTSVETHTALYLSVISVGELHMGSYLLPHSRRRAELEVWLGEYLVPWRRGRILPFTESIAQRWGELTASRQRVGRPLPIADGLIAATAAVHDLVLVTRNQRDFEELGLELVDPWQEGNTEEVRRSGC